MVGINSLPIISVFDTVVIVLCFRRTKTKDEVKAEIEIETENEAVAEGKLCSRHYFSIIIHVLCLVAKIIYGR